MTIITNIKQKIRTYKIGDVEDPELYFGIIVGDSLHECQNWLDDQDVYWDMTYEIAHDFYSLGHRISVYLETDLDTMTMFKLRFPD